jgi:hypothetical protein
VVKTNLFENRSKKRKTMARRVAVVVSHSEKDSE